MRILGAEILDASQYGAAVSLLGEYLDWVLTLESFAREAPGIRPRTAGALRNTG